MTGTEVDDIDSYFNDGPIKEIDDSNKSSVVLGIDLGTTNSCVGIWRKNNLEISPDAFGYRTISSVVAFTEKSTWIGREDKRQIELNPENTFYEVKRLIGKKINDQTVVDDMEFLTYKVDTDESNNILLKSNLTTRKN